MTNSKNVISYITLGVNDLVKMHRFYSALGFDLLSQGGAEHPYVLFKSGAIVLALYPKHLLAKQAGCEIAEWNNNSAMSLSLNVENKQQVDHIIALAIKHSAKLTRQGFEPAWGGYCAYFKDPENNLWEIVWHEKFAFNE